jgi:membrane protease YdiL (CAAX protease family)
MSHYFKTLTPKHQLLLLFILTISSWTFFTIGGSALGFFLFGSDSLLAPNQLINNPSYLKYFQTIQSIGLFIAPPLIFAWLCYDRPIEELKLNKRAPIALYVLSISIVIVAQPIISFTGIFNSNLELPAFLSDLEQWIIAREKEAQYFTEVFLESNNWNETLINVLLIAVLPALGEELLFRGAMQTTFVRIFKNIHVAIWFSAAIFSAFHIQFLGFLPRFILGILFGYLMIYGRSIWLPILAHFTNNLLAFVLYQAYAETKEGINPIQQSGQEYPNIIWIILSFLGVIILMGWLYKIYKKNKSST